MSRTASSGSSCSASGEQYPTEHIYINLQDEAYQNPPMAQLYPKEAVCGEAVEIALVYDGQQMLGNQNLKAWLEKDQDSYDEQLLLEELNPYSFKFTVTELVPCKLTVRLHLGDIFIQRLHLTFVSPSTKTAPLDFIRTTQPLLDMLDCVLTGIQGAKPQAQIDQRVANHFNKKVKPADLQLLFDSYSMFLDTGSDIVNSEIPTILHLVAKHNLLEMCRSLTDYAGFSNAGSIYNMNGRTAARLAAIGKNKELAEALGDYVSMKKQLDDLREMLYGEILSMDMDEYCPSEVIPVYDEMNQEYFMVKADSRDESGHINPKSPTSPGPMLPPRLPPSPTAQRQLQDSTAKKKQFVEEAVTEKLSEDDILDNYGEILQSKNPVKAKNYIETTKQYKAKKTEMMNNNLYKKPTSVFGQFKSMLTRKKQADTQDIYVIQEEELNGRMEVHHTQAWRHREEDVDLSDDDREGYEKPPTSPSHRNCNGLVLTITNGSAHSSGYHNSSSSSSGISGGTLRSTTSNASSSSSSSSSGTMRSVDSISSSSSDTGTLKSTKSNHSKASAAGNRSNQTTGQARTIAAAAAQSTGTGTQKRQQGARPRVAMSVATPAAQHTRRAPPAPPTPTIPPDCPSYQAPTEPLSEPPPIPARPKRR